MMIGAWMGAKLLNEGNVARRVIGSCLIAGGVAALFWTWKRKREGKPVIPDVKAPESKAA